MKKQPTAQEVARLAGVSQSAVSRTFTPGASVSEATRAKVLEAAGSLGYRPNALARHTVSSVTSDNYRGGRLVAELLVARGYRRIAFLAGLENSSTSIERERGLNDGLAAAGLAVAARAAGHYNFEQAKAATRELLAGRRRRIDALFAANDHMAIAAMDVARHELGLRIPEDLGVVGFDDVPQAAWSAYDLTTVVQSVEQMVDQTVELLMQQVEGTAQRRHVVIPCTLVERGSLRPAPH